MIDSVDSLESTLRRGRNADGGWGYYAGKRSRLEPTCWALLALPDMDASALRTWPVRDGLLLERVEGDPNHAFHALAMLVFVARGIEHASGNAALLDGLQGVRGEKLPSSTINRQDNSLEGWSWIANTFSWVEPTAWCLLALKRFRRSNPSRVDAQRIAQAEALLIDRCCAAGGWNYGNANMLGQQLEPYIPTTAIALLALQDKQSDPTFTRSREYLIRETSSEKSGLALSLAVLALSVMQQETDAVVTTLVNQLPTTIGLGNQFAQAMALYALRGKQKHDALAL